MTKRSARAIVSAMDERRRDRIAGVAALMGIAFFVASLVVMIWSEEAWLGGVLFLVTFGCVVVLHFTNDPDNRSDY